MQDVSDDTRFLDKLRAMKLFSWVTTTKSISKVKVGKLKARIHSQSFAKGRSFFLTPKSRSGNKAKVADSDDSTIVVG